MTPVQFEEITVEYFKKLGYRTTLTPPTNDFGADLFAEKNGEKVVVQAKMYGNSSRKVNRKCLMELHGVKDYYECTKAVLATDGLLMPDAVQVAKKLKIKIINPISDKLRVDVPISVTSKERLFDAIWRDFIIPLQGKTLYRSNGDSNKILSVSWSDIVRVSSNGRSSSIGIEIFKDAVKYLEINGSITRDYINQNYDRRASSGIVLILSQVPIFSLTRNPLTLHYNAND